MAAQAQRIEVAGQLLASALEGMDAVREELGGDRRAVPRAGWERAAEAAVTALAHLEDLRRLFFSIAQMVRELAERQTELADATQDALALAVDPDRDGRELAAQLVGAQGELAERTLQIANALVEQADAPPPEEQEGAAEAAEKLRRAAEHVVVAQEEMDGATAALGPPASADPEFEMAREHQDVSLIELAQALELLTPPQQQGDPGEEGDQGEEGDRGEQGEEGEEQEPQEAGPQADPSQLLQGVRDREAQRRRDRDQGQSGYDTVEKDW